MEREQLLRIAVGCRWTVLPIGRPGEN